MMIWAMLVVAELLTFTLTIGQYGNKITLTYPVADNLRWVEVCVESEGVESTLQSNGQHWYEKNCWPPRFKVEDHKLRVGAIHVRAHLEIEMGGSHVMLHTPVYQVRPEAEEQ